MDSVKEIKGMTVSFDGTTVRSTSRMKRYKNPLHIVSAQIAEYGITFGQKAVDGKSNEISAVRELIELLEIKGCLIVADALNCQKETVKTIAESGGDYLLSVKDNQPNLKSEISEYVEDDSLREMMDTAIKHEKTEDGLKPEPHTSLTNLIGCLAKRNGRSLPVLEQSTRNLKLKTANRTNGIITYQTGN